MLTPGELLDTFNHPSTAHAALVHAPIVLTALAAVLAVVSAIALGKRPALRVAALLGCLLAAGSAWGAKITGESAYDAMGDPPRVARQLAHDHEGIAEQATYLATLAAVLALGAWLPKRSLAVTGAWLAAGASGASAYWAATAAHHGGGLVYTYGVGTPKPVTQLNLTPDMETEPGDLRLVAFEQSVRPVLSTYCYGCHGSGERPAGGLSLTTARAILAGGGSGPAVIPGDPEGSLLYQSVTGSHPELSMPPGDRQPTMIEIAALREWIESGAVWAPEE